MSDNSTNKANLSTHVNQEASYGYTSLSGLFVLLLAYVHWNLNMWRTAMYSNEFRFYIQQLNCKVRVRRMCREGILITALTHQHLLVKGVWWSGRSFVSMAFKYWRQISMQRVIGMNSYKLWKSICPHCATKLS